MVRIHNKPFVVGSIVLCLIVMFPCLWWFSSPDRARVRLLEDIETHIPLGSERLVVENYLHRRGYPVHPELRVAGKDYPIPLHVKAWSRETTYRVNYRPWYSRTKMGIVLMLNDEDKLGLYAVGEAQQ